jgi:hypothetical protein
MACLPAQKNKGGQPGVEGGAAAQARRFAGLPGNNLKDEFFCVDIRFAGG